MSIKSRIKHGPRDSDGTIAFTLGFFLWWRSWILVIGLTISVYTALINPPWVSYIAGFFGGVLLAEIGLSS